MTTASDIQALIAQARANHADAAWSADPIVPAALDALETACAALDDYCDCDEMHGNHCNSCRALASIAACLRGEK